jgi:hypothetical protein
MMVTILDITLLLSGAQLIEQVPTKDGDRIKSPKYGVLNKR